MRRIIIIIFIFFSGIAGSQTVPWFFNTHTFRNWVQEKEIETLLFSSYKPIEVRQYGGYSHHTSNGEKDFVNLSGYFRKYTLDSLGFIKSVITTSVDIQYLNKNKSGRNNDHFYDIMVKMAAKNYKPEKNITHEINSLGSTIYRFTSALKDTSIYSKGEGVKNADGLIYRESGSNFFDNETSLHYNYDITLHQIINFQNNNPVKISSFNFQGDFYDPITNDISYSSSNDSLSILTFEGTKVKPYYYYPYDLWVDTSYQLPYSRFKSRVNLNDIKEKIPNLKIHTGSDSILHFGHKELLNSKIQNSSLITENYTSHTNSKRRQEIYHSLRYDKMFDRITNYSAGYPFELSYDWEFGNYLDLIRDKPHYISNPFIHIKTQIRQYKNEEIKEVKHFFYNRTKNSWDLISAEKYNENGYLRSIEFTPNNYYQNSYYDFLGERTDFGFIRQNYLRQRAVGEYNEQGNFKIKNKDGEIIVKTSDYELIIADNSRCNDNSCTHQNDTSYCQAHYLIIR